MLDKDTGSTDQSAAEFRASVKASFDAGSKRMARIESTLEHNTTAIEGLAAQNHEMYELFSTMKGGFKVLEWFGRLAKWGTGVAAGAAALCKTMGWWPFSN